MSKSILSIFMMWLLTCYIMDIAENFTFRNIISRQKSYHKILKPDVSCIETHLTTLQLFEKSFVSRLMATVHRKKRKYWRFFTLTCVLSKRYNLETCRICVNILRVFFFVLWEQLHQWRRIKSEVILTEWAERHMLRRSFTERNFTNLRFSCIIYSLFIETSVI